MDPWRSPEKVLTGPPCDQMTDLTFDPGPSFRANDHASDSATALTSRYGATARPLRAGRSPGCRASSATTAPARSKTTDPKDGSMDDPA